MGRTIASGIRVSAGKSSKKMGGGSTSNSSGSSSKSKGGGSKLPPIPFQETPLWQKPITNFFKTDVPSDNKENEILDKSNDTDEAGPSIKKLKNERLNEEDNKESKADVTSDKDDATNTKSNITNEAGSSNKKLKKDCFSEKDNK